MDRAPLAARPEDRGQTLGEEIANAASHGAGLMAILAATPLLLAAAMRRGSFAAILGAAVFAGSAALLYFASALYHAMPACRAKEFFRMLDHVAIYLLIAGSFTPFTLGPLKGPFGWTMFTLIWLLALAGVLFKLLARYRFPRLSASLYLGMGWLGVLLIRPLSTHLPPEGLRWLELGGAAYTVGIIFFAWKRLRYAHFVWHLFVLAGTACHFVAVLWYAT